MDSVTLEEEKNLQRLLEPYEEIKQKNKINSLDVVPRIEPLPQEDFAPCIENIIKKEDPSEGKHRALAILASYLYEVGWEREKSFKLWSGIAEKVDVEFRIFDVWYEIMNCPNCETIKKNSSGYPEVGLGGLGYCEDCWRTAWPGQEKTVGPIEISDITQTSDKGELKCVKFYFVVFV